MGGRGKWSMPTADGFTWYDYHKVYEDEDVHILVQHSHNESGPSSPVMSKTPDVTYMLLNDKDEPKCIGIYKDRIKQFDIDLDKFHQGIKPHVHHCDEHGHRLPNEPIEDMIPSKHEQQIIDKVSKIYSKYKKELEK